MRISPASIEQFCKKRNPALEIGVPQRGMEPVSLTGWDPAP
jgi:hypothetical protein